MKRARSLHAVKRMAARPALWIGLLIGCLSTVAVRELPYVNWRRVAAPIDGQPLTIRHDAKGDGRFASSRSGNRRHRGVDLTAELGSPVRAIQSGTVVQVGHHRGLGRFVELEHRHQMHSLYAHLDEIAVEPRERVRQGERIGTIGKTGNARHPSITPHLHLEVSKSGEPFNPQALGLRMVEPPARTAQADDTLQDEESDASGGD